MSKFASQRTPVTGPVTVTDEPTHTHEGGPAWVREAKGDLFLLAVTNMVGEDTFYESATARDERFRKLVHQVVAEDSGWVARLVPYLRDVANMRSASVVLAAEYVAAGGPNGRGVVASALQRADEPGEMLAYWRLAHGRNVPKPVKRGVADAAIRLYDQRSALRYDGQGQGWRFGDVLDVAHPLHANDEQAELFTYLLDKRHGRTDPRTGAKLNRIWADRELMDVPVDARRGYLSAEKLFAEAGWSWERLAGWLPGGMDAEAWESVIPRMGYMALLRNLRNFDEKGVSDEVAESIVAKLTDPEEVAKSRQFPFRFWSAYRFAPGHRWLGALEKALDLATQNVPALPGRTLVLIDTSASMQQPVSGKSKIAHYEVGAIFAASLAKRCGSANVDVVQYATTSGLEPFKPSQSVLRYVEDVNRQIGKYEHGTNTWEAIGRHLADHQRVVVFTDGQTADHGQALSAKLHLFNTAGYGPAMARGERVYEYGGFTDATFRLLAILDAGRSEGWPF